jgi:hypothetical protein
VVLERYVRSALVSTDPCQKDEITGARR